MDEHGYFNFSASVTYGKALSERAKLLIIETSPQLPYVYGSEASVHASEVDFVIEAAKGLLPIEVKATTRPRLADAAHLRNFRAEYRSRARSGLLLHGGSAIEWLAPDVLAAPWWMVV